MASAGAPDGGNSTVLLHTTGENAMARKTLTSVDTVPITPTPNSKISIVIDLLQREEGATLDDLMTATGWQPHSTRAALTGLRKKGYAIA